MPNTSKATLTCSRCGAKFTVDTYSSINVAADPELKEKVKSGELFMHECPQCGNANLARHTTLYHDPEQKILICLTDQPLSSDGLEGYTCRLVSDVGSLIEKVKIFDAGLDDLAVEMCKYVTKMEMEKSDIELKFLKMDGADGEITMTYPQDGKMEMIVIGSNVYDDCCGIISRNPALKEKATGLVKVDGVWLSQYLR